MRVSRAPHHRFARPITSVRATLRALRYVWYNTVCRAKGPGNKVTSDALTRFETICKGNTYTTTLWSINCAFQPDP